jgi:hypothetical protein
MIMKNSVFADSHAAYRAIEWEDLTWTHDGEHICKPFLKMEVIATVNPYQSVGEFVHFHPNLFMQLEAI